MYTKGELLVFISVFMALVVAGAARMIVSAAFKLLGCM